MNDDPKFRYIRSYYKMFSHEMSQGSVGLSQTIINLAAIKNLTFEKLLISMGEAAEWNGIDEFLIVGHGLHTDPRLGEEQALGLTMPIDDKSGLKTDSDVLYYLAQCLKDGTSEDKFTNMNGSKKFAKGKVASIMATIRSLQQLRIRRVEFRSCTLGQNPALLEVMGKLLGTRHCVAPKVHCAYAQLNPQLVQKDADFDRQVSQKGNARVFTNAYGSERVAMQLFKDGRNWCISSSKDMKWFVDQYIYPSNTYFGGNLHAPLFVAGMDTTGFSNNLFALPQEKAYGDMLVWIMNMDSKL
jgi:hypothetical protein